MSRENIQSVVDKAVEEFGTTNNVNIAGYVLNDGRMLDLSGKKLGARGDSRTVDHREVATYALSENNIDYGTNSEAMMKFMAMGNIRLMPETH